MRSVPLGVWAGLALATLSACRPSLPVPDRAHIRCATDADCPPDTHRCAALVTRCVPRDAERKPPALLPGAALDRDRATVGVEVTATFEVDEDLAVDPVVELGAPERPPFRKVSAQGRRYRYALPVAPGAEGAWPVLVSLVDANGNPAADLNGGVLVLDFTQPQIDRYRVAGRRVLSENAEGVVEFTASEQLKSVQARLAGGGALAPGPDSAPPSWQLVYRATGRESQTDAADVELRLEDLAGNVAGGPDGLRKPGFSFDFVRPELRSWHVATPLVRAGEQAEVWVTFSEPVPRAPALSLTPPAGDALPLTAVSAAGTAWRYVRAIADPDAVCALRLDAYSDEAGNAGEGTDLGEVRIDSTPPHVLPGSAEVTPERAAAGVLVTAVLEASEPVDEPRVVLDLPSRPAFAPVGREGNRWTYVLAVGAGGDWAEGTRAVLATLQDEAGNRTEDAPVGYVVLDLQPPRVVRHEAGPRVLGPSAVGTVEFAVDEPVREPEVRLSTGLALVAEPVAAQTYRCRFSPPAGAAGTADVHVTLRDKAGNLAGPTTLGTFEFDFQPPDLARAQVSRRVARDGQAVGVWLTFTEPLGADPVVQLVPAAGAARRLSVLSRSGFEYELLHEIDAGVDPDGVYGLRLDAFTDVARNGTAGRDLGTVEVDSTPPRILELRTERAVHGPRPPHDQVVLRFELSEPPDPAGGLTAALDGEPMDCGTDAALARACTSAVGPGAGEQIRQIAVRAVDRAGNGAYAGTSVVFDYEPPTVPPQAWSLQLLPDPATNPLAAVSAAGPGTLVRVAFALSEAPAAVAVVARDGAGGEIEFAREQGSGTGFTYRWPPPGGAPLPASGGWRVLVRAKDEVDNATDSALANAPAPSFVVDGEPPDPPRVDAEGAVVYRRAPWGGEQGFAPAFRVDGASDAAPERGTLLAVDRPARPWLELGRQEASADRSFRVELRPADRPEVWLALADGAGNLSTAVRVRDVEWTATLGGRRPGSDYENPHRLEQYGSFREVLRPYGGFEAVGTDVGGLGDGALVRTAGRGSWRRASLAANPPRRDLLSAVRDEARGRLVLFGASDYCADPPTCAPLWEHDGFTWAPAATADPEGDGNPSEYWARALAWDARRGVTVLYGATSGRETWEWDGASWRRRWTQGEGPGARVAHAMGYDPRRGATVLFGGGLMDAGTWEWDGEAWRLAPDAGTDGPPTGRDGAAMAWDPVGGRLLLFGGELFEWPQEEGPSCDGNGLDLCDVLWSWDGARWRRHDAAGPRPAARTEAGLAFDEERGRLVLWGGHGEPGCDGGDDEACVGLWEWDGAAWSRPATTDPEGDGNPNARYVHALAWDALRRRVVAVGQDLDEPCDTAAARRCLGLWEWTGSSWRRLAPDDRGGDGSPEARRDTAMVWDPLRERAVLFGGGAADLDCGANVTTMACDDLWEWDGADWIRRALDPRPIPREGHAMIWDPVRGRTVMTGGIAVNPGHTWEYDGWQWLDIVDGPLDTYQTRLAYDAERSRAVAVGQRGVGGGGWENRTWVRAGATWTLAASGRPSATNPGAREGHALAWDAARRRVVLFGGDAHVPCANDQDLRCDDVWEWDGAAWSARTRADPEGDGHPAARKSHMLVAAPQLGGLLLFGGNTSTGFVNDLWLWNGASWRRIDQADPEGDGDPAPRTVAGTAWDAARRQLVVFGGGGDAQNDGATWLWSDGEGARPGQLLRVQAGRAGLAGGEALRRLSIAWHARGAGWDGAQQKPGARLLRWEAGRWRPAYESPAEDPDAPLRWETDDAATMRRMMHGAATGLAFAALPRHANGAPLRPATLESDYVQVVLRYRLAP